MPETARTDTCHAIPSARPELPTTEMLLPTRPDVATYTVNRWWRRPPAKHVGLAFGAGLATVTATAYLIFEALVGMVAS